MLLGAAETEPFVLSGPVLWMPLAAAMLFAFGALCLKRSSHWRIGVWRTTLVSNVLTALIFLPLLFLGGQIPHWSLLWQPLVVAALYFIGQVTTVLAMTRGDVSVAAPVLGLKLLLVAIFSTLLVAKPLPGDIWLACALATAGIVLLNASGGKAHHHHIWFSIVAAGAAALAFSLFDICVQQWVAPWGVGVFLPIAFSISGLLTLGLLPLLEDRMSTVPRAAWPWLAAGGGLIGVQSLLITLTVAIWGQAAAVNVAYSTRGLWGVVLVWVLGTTLGLHDQAPSGRVLLFRLGGALLLLASVVLLVV